MSAADPLGPTEAEVFDFLRVLRPFLASHKAAEQDATPARVRLDLLHEMARSRLTRAFLETDNGGTMVALTDRVFQMDAATRVFLSLTDFDHEPWGDGRTISDAANVRLMEALLRLEPWRADTGPTHLCLVKGGDQ